MIEIIDQAQKKKKLRDWKPNALAMEEMLLMDLELREYRTYFHVASGYQKAVVIEISSTIPPKIKHPDFALPRKMEYEVFIIDATEKRKHITQVVVDKKSKQIICTAFSNG